MMKGSEEFRRLGPPLGPEAEAQRADAFLARHFPFHTRNQWKALCRREGLLVNGRPVRPGYRLRCGDRLTMHHPLDAEPEVDGRLVLIAEAGGVLAVAKPGNLPMHEGGLFRRNTFEGFLAELFGKEWAPVHRLDRETSGIVLCAATPELRRDLSQAFEQGLVRKRYLALLSGRPSWDELLVDQPLGLAVGTRRPRFEVTPGGKDALTIFRVLGRGTVASLVEALPRTGKTNQIRVHAAWTGHALIGDKVYHAHPDVFAAYCEDGDTPRVRLLAGNNRHALHAARLEVTHPVTGRRFTAEAELPPDLAALWAREVELEGHSAPYVLSQQSVFIDERRA